MIVHLLYKFPAQHSPTPEDLIAVSDDKHKLTALVRDHAAAFDLIVSTTDHPKFTYELVRRNDLTIAFYIYIREMRMA